MEQDLDDIFGVSTTPITPSISMSTAGDDEIDALFGLDTPDPGMESAVREAMEADRHNGVVPETSPFLKLSPSTPGTTYDESFNDIFGDSPVNSSTSDVMSQFAALHSEMDETLTSLESKKINDSSDVGVTSSSNRDMFSLSDDDDDDEVTEFDTSGLRVVTSAVVLDQGSPTPSPLNASTKKRSTTADKLSSFFRSSTKAISEVAAGSTMKPRRVPTLTSSTMRGDANKAVGDSREKIEEVVEIVVEKVEHVEESEEVEEVEEVEKTSQEPIGEATKSSARAMVTRRTRRASSSSSVDAQASRKMDDAEVQRALERVDQLVSSSSSKSDVPEERIDELRTLCLLLFSSEAYYSGKHVLKGRGEIWSMMLGVSSHEKDRTLENDMLACDSLQNSAEMREECREASVWAVEKNKEEGERRSSSGSTGRTDSVDVDGLTADMELLVRFWSSQHKGTTCSSNTNTTTTTRSSYVAKDAYLAAPFYSSGLDHTTTIYKCMHAMEVAIIPGLHRRGGSGSSSSSSGSSISGVRARYVEEWRTMAVTMFQFLLKYHDPMLANHLGMEGIDGGKDTNGGGCGVTSYLIPHGWLLGGFLDECGRDAATTSPSSESRRRRQMSFETLSVLWDYMIVDSNPMFSWYVQCCLDHF